jgi:hypothetical protein
VRVALHITPPSTQLQVVKIFTPPLLFVVITPQLTLGTPHNNLQCSLHQGVNKTDKVGSVVLKLKGCAVHIPQHHLLPKGEVKKKEQGMLW